MFYPATSDELRRQVDALIAAAASSHRRRRAPKALIVPHAGYPYSGPIAASAYARLQPWADRVERVVLLGPTHRVPVRGLALPGVERFETPLGSVDIDTDAIASLADLHAVVDSPHAHAFEHSLEVQLPFLQQVLGNFKLVPLAVGDAHAYEVAAVLERLWGGAETLVVVSSDLSHYRRYDEARAVDAATVHAMLALDARLDHWQACGATPLNGLFTLARRRGCEVELLDLRNSGDTAGDRARVVGYAALALFESHAATHADERGAAADADADKGAVLLAHARASLADALGERAPVAPDAVFLHRPGATFVTLRAGGELRGCIGVLEARRPLGEDVRANARAAAFEDPRFVPVTRAEYAQISIEVSLLSVATPIVAASEAHARALLRPGIDGVTLEYGAQRGTFLPQVWRSVPEPRRFLAALKRKAGLPSDFWSDEVKLSRYTVEHWAEPAAEDLCVQ
jgi:hypothetical protein